MLNQKQETYNGWSNRETWCLSLWLDNDEGLSDEVQKLVRTATRRLSLKSPQESIDDAVCALTKGLQRYVDDLIEERDVGNTGLRTMFDDIGSLYRINWRELASSLIENA